MKFKKIIYYFIFLQALFLTALSFAHDTDLYTSASEGVKPNVLFIIDNSCSMKSSVATGADPYSPAFNSPTGYPADPSYPTINKDYVYEFTGSWDKTLQDLKVFKTSISLVACSTASNNLTNKGVTYNTNTNSACDKTKKTLMTGDFLNYYLYNGKWLADLPKIDIAKRVVTDLLESVNGINAGLMIFTPGGDGGKVMNYLSDIDIDTNRNKLIGDVNAIVNECGTPLGKALYEAGLYFQGKPSYFNAPENYSTRNPIQYACQKNFAVFMTDGMASSDDSTPSPLPGDIGDQDSDGKEPGNPNHFLDDVAKYLYDNDLSTKDGKQNIVTYTIDFLSGSSTAKELLSRASTYGHGKSYTSDNALQLAGAFTAIINEVLAETTSFVAPIVPVSKMERATAGDKMYLAFFKPKMGTMWTGNIKKYGVQQTNDPSNGLVIGDILDVSGSKALDSNGAFYPGSRSYWSSSSDGGDAEKGGVGEILKARTAARKIYTLLPGIDSDLDALTGDSDTSFDLTNSWNAFTTTNSRLTKEILGIPSDTDKNNLINFVHGIDAYDDNLNGFTTDKRDWLLGAFLHSRPFVINYADRAVIYAGANDGMLHAFDDATGEELWGFIPPNLLGRLKDLHTTTPGVFVDGSPKAYVVYNSSGNATKAILIFGLRRGGNYYYGLDVTNPTSPKFAYRIYKGKLGYFNQIGQTWSNPFIGKVAYGTGEKWVAIFGAGYDEGQDDENPPPDDVGRGIYLADVDTGAYVWGRSGVGVQDPAEATMTYCIPSDIAPIDLDGDGKIDRIYVGDLNSRIWRFNISDLNHDGSSDTSEWTMKKIFEPDLSEKRKIFYPPDVTFEKDGTGEYEMLFFGTGDREDPKTVHSIKERLYSLKDRNYSGTLIKTDLVDMSLYYQKTPEEQALMLNNLKSKYGWWVELAKAEGEKCLAPPVVYAKTAYFTTFSPTIVGGGDPCFIGEGTGTLYAMNYATAEAAFNLDLTNDTGGTVIGRTDRRITIGSAIPSGVVITVIGGKVVAYIGVGGGVYRPTLSSTRSIFPIHWKLVF